MKNFNFKTVLPHLIAIGVFLFAALLIGKDGLSGNLVLKQGDISSWQAMAKQSMDYKEAHGHFPLWVSSMFSGMPAYQIAIEGAWNPLTLFSNALSLWLPQPMNFFFLACICFYILTQCMGLRPVAGIFGSLAFAFCSYNPILITAGHVTKMLAIAYAPAVIGGVLLIFRKKYLTGLAVTAFFTSMQIAPGHQQVSYYLFIVLAIMSVSYIIYQYKKGETSHLLKSLGLIVIAGILGVATNAISLLPTYDFAKESKRGGQLIMDDTDKGHEKIVEGRTTGLSKDYAFQWSYGKAETMTLMFPGVNGYGLYSAQRDGESYLFPMIKDDSKALEQLSEMAPQAASDPQLHMFLSSKLYWGTQPFTSGPVYLGAIVCMLFILGLFFLDNKNKWWIFAASVVGILMAWGSNLPGLNYFLFDHLPLYNKFRAPTQALIIPEWLAPLLGALYLDKITRESKDLALVSFKKGMIAVAAVFAIALFYYMSADFSNAASDQNLIQQFIQMMGNNADAQSAARKIVSGLVEDRKALFGADIFRSFVYVLIAAALLWLYFKNKLKDSLLLWAIALLSFLDLYLIASKYLNDKSYGYKEEYEASEFPLTASDAAIMKDPDPNYRVFDMNSGDPFQNAKPSYYHKSIGGYHAAKLGIYDDLTANALTDSTGRLNMGVINMLNTKYIIQDQNGKATAMPNPEANGNAWFVQTVLPKNGAVAVMRSLHGLNTKDTAVIFSDDAAKISGLGTRDSTATIRQTSFDNDAISYESNNSANGFAVFSEVYYKDWNAYIDGKKADIIRTNYVLRGLVIPAGKHKIDFKFEPQLFFKSKTVSMITNWLLFALILGSLAMYLIRNKNQQ